MLTLFDRLGVSNAALKPVVEGGISDEDCLAEPQSWWGRFSPSWSHKTIYPSKQYRRSKNLQIVREIHLSKRKRGFRFRC